MSSRNNTVIENVEYLDTLNFKNSWDFRRCHNSY